MSERKVVREVAEMIGFNDPVEAIETRQGRRRPIHRPQAKTQIATDKVHCARKRDALWKRWMKAKKTSRELSSPSARAEAQWPAPGSGQGKMKPEQLDIVRLKREVKTLKAERGILKEPLLLREGVDLKFSFIAKHRAI